MSVVPHLRNNEDFPLNVFVKCAACGQPLTGSWNKGRSKHYPNYRCRNKNCKAVSIRKEALERQFLHLLHRLTPTPEFLLLFRDIVLAAWNNRQAESEAQVSAIKQQLRTLTDRKNTLVDRYLDGRVSEQTYKEQDERLSSEIADARSALLQAEVNDEEIDALLGFADRVLLDPAGLWSKTSLAQRQRLQRVLFPKGLEYSKTEGFGTGQNPSFFKMLADLEADNSSLASPTGFEPVLPP